MSNDKQDKEKAIKAILIITILIILNIIFVIRVINDITGTGIIYRETSPDGQYELIVHREKFPEHFGYSDERNTVKLYEKSSETLISYFEMENWVLFAVHPTFNVSWLNDGVVFQAIDGFEPHNVTCILPFESE